MERTPNGTPVGIDDPYRVAGVCDHLTDDGRCRYALAFGGADADFTAERRADGWACHVGEAGDWSACPKYRSTTDGHDCIRCGLEEVRMPHDGSRPLLEVHHLQYGSSSGSGDEGTHEITVSLCRWCHAKVHNSIARIDDDAGPDPDAIAERERRRTLELSETAFETAADRGFEPGVRRTDAGRGGRDGDTTKDF